MVSVMVQRSIVFNIFANKQYLKSLSKLVSVPVCMESTISEENLEVLFFFCRCLFPDF